MQLTITKEKVLAAAMMATMAWVVIKIYREDKEAMRVMRKRK